MLVASAARRNPSGVFHSSGRRLLCLSWAQRAFVPGQRHQWVHGDRREPSVRNEAGSVCVCIAKVNCDCPTTSPVKPGRRLN